MPSENATAAPSDATAGKKAYEHPYFSESKLHREMKVSEDRKNAEVIGTHSYCLFTTGWFSHLFEDACWSKALS